MDYALAVQEMQTVEHGMRLHWRQGVHPIDIGLDPMAAAGKTRGLVPGDFDEIAAGFGGMFPGQPQRGVEVSAFGKPVVSDFECSDQDGFRRDRVV